jgi:hypothetical protein
MSTFRPRLAATAAFLLLVVVACSPAADPELVAAPSPAVVATPVPASAAAPTPTMVPTATATPAPTPVPVPALTRGVTDETITIAVVKTGGVFGDVDVGVRARLARLREAGGVGGRQIELVEVVDDGADRDAALEAVTRLVEQDQIFAVILASVVPDPVITDYLASQSMPFVGWGFAPGFCTPNEWGFGLNGCLLGTVLGIEGATADTSARELIGAAFGDKSSVALVVTDDIAGAAAEALGADTWGEQLVGTIRVGPETELASVETSIGEIGPDVVLLSVDLDTAIELKGCLQSTFSGPVVDDVTYLPGLLSDFNTADKLEGGYAITQFPPQEEYREVTALIANDLETVGAPLIYSQAISVGYWSADLLAALLDATGPDLNTATFHQTANIDGVLYDPGLAGALCPIDTRDIHRSAAGGAAMVRVVGGIYRPAASFTCF